MPWLARLIMPALAMAYKRFLGPVRVFFFWETAASMIKPFRTRVRRWALLLLRTRPAG